MTEEKVMVNDHGLVERKAVFASTAHSRVLLGFNSNTLFSKHRPSCGALFGGIQTRLPLAGIPKLVLGLAVVFASMLALFSVPREYFVAATFVATACMMAAAFMLGGFRAARRPQYLTVAFGVVSALILYLIFYVGGAAVNAFHPFGMTSASEASVYALIAAPSNPLYLQIGVLLFDSAGYESFFRGVLQRRLQPKIGPAAAPAIALLDAGLHIATLNPVWVAGTFVTDLVWGLTYYYGKGARASFTSHFIWDLAIFIVRPVT